MKWSCAIRPGPKARANMNMNMNIKIKIQTLIKNGALKLAIRPAANRHEENSLKSDLLPNNRFGRRGPKRPLF
jgi:hypothetical protein